MLLEGGHAVVSAASRVDLMDLLLSRSQSRVERRREAAFQVGAAWRELWSSLERVEGFELN